MSKIIVTFLFSLFSLLPLHSQSLGICDSIRVSLLTCSEGNDNYTYYGHTALRIVPFDGKDVVVNYGLFSFDQPNFIWRFIIGEPDYTVGLQFTNDFLAAYKQEGRDITEQHLNLTQSEAKALISIITKDLATPNWHYRYNYLYDNCTTRVLYALKSAIKGEVKLIDAKSSATSKKNDLSIQNTTTYRQMIWKAAYEKSPWVAFGQDLLFGSELNQPISFEQSATFPLQAMLWADFSNIIYDDGSTKSLVLDQTFISASHSVDDSRIPITPFVAAMIYLFVVGVVSFFTWIGKTKPGRIVDNATLFVQGVVGCVITFMFFFSEQPGVDTNMLVLVFNPLPLLYLPFKIVRDARGLSDYWMRYVQSILIMTVFLLCHFLTKQEISHPLLIILVAMWLRSILYDVLHLHSYSKHNRFA